MIGYEKEKGVVVVVFYGALGFLLFFFLLWFLRVLRLRLVMRVKKKEAKGAAPSTAFVVCTLSRVKKKVLFFITAKDREKGKLR